ncbi:MAG: HlyD family secretion protein [Proteobacteria bacterium]|nr:HlyD family secretion protein [Pseudomonadota bacterium]
MLELLFCAFFTILPDFLVRRYAQGKRIGVEINLFSVWYELRYGITACAMLTVALITLVFYYHPSTTNMTSFFRTVTILPEGAGRVKEVYVTNNQSIQAGDKIFKLDASKQIAAVKTAKNRIAEIDAALVVTKSDLNAAAGVVIQAEGSVKQAQDELDVKQTLFDSGSTVVNEREIIRLKTARDGRQGTLDATIAGHKSMIARVTLLLPARRATAVSELKEAEVSLSKTIVYASTAGTITQFALQPGDYVNPLLRPAGILIPEIAGAQIFQAGFGQMAAQVIKPGMIGEITCFSQPYKIIPMLVTDVQNAISSGQFRPGDQLVDVQDRPKPGTLTVFMKPLFEGQIDKILPGSKCIANVYTNNHEALESDDISTSRWLFYHMVDAVGVVHALILRIQALMLPVKILVFSGH